ncbi:PIN domain-containing protein [Candidatus Woesearchaeota archaeon]|nr:PIN domain-containing protein [Candidatus Woesearchaeota archaeon]
MTLVLDTYAWIEYFEGSSQGIEVRKLLESGEEPLCTPSVVLAEIGDAYAKGKINARWQEIANFITFNTQLQPINPEIAFQAGRLKNEIRKRFTGFGLIDGIILATAKFLNGKVVTGDFHLTHLEEVIDISKKSGSSS